MYKQLFNIAFNGISHVSNDFFKVDSNIQQIKKYNIRPEALQCIIENSNFDNPILAYSNGIISITLQKKHSSTDKIDRYTITVSIGDNFSNSEVLKLNYDEKYKIRSHIKSLIDIIEENKSK